MEHVTHSRKESAPEAPAADFLTREEGAEEVNHRTSIDQSCACSHRCSSTLSSCVPNARPYFFTTVKLRRGQRWPWRW